MTQILSESVISPASQTGAAGSPPQREAKTGRRASAAARALPVRDVHGQPAASFGWLPAAPLHTLVEAQGGLKACSVRKGASDPADAQQLFIRFSRAYYRAGQSGWISERQADELSVRVLGLHPMEIWADDWLVAIADGAGECTDDRDAEIAWRDQGRSELRDRGERVSVSARAVACSAPGAATTAVSARASTAAAACSAGTDNATRATSVRRYVEAAVHVLKATGAAMTAHEIVEYIAEHDVTTLSGATPARTVNRDLHAALKRGDTRLRKTDRPGVFTLA